jgi:hypothetical protein
LVEIASQLRVLRAGQVLALGTAKQVETAVELAAQKIFGDIVLAER